VKKNLISRIKLFIFVNYNTIFNSFQPQENPNRNLNLNRKPKNLVHKERRTKTGTKEGRTETGTKEGRTKTHTKEGSYIQW